MHIQPFEEKYTDQVANLILSIQIGEFQVPITRQDQPDLADIAGVYQQNKGNFWVALSDDQVVGTIAAIDFGGNMLALRKMFVHRDFRGKELGTAQQLWDTLEAWCATKGIQSVFLGTIEKLVAARKFYARNGFVEINKADLPHDFPLMAVDTLFYKKELLNEAAMPQ